MEASGTFADFLAQMPGEIIRIFFIFAILLVMTFAAYIWFKLREGRARTEGTNTGNNPSQAAATAPPTPATSTGSDMPDIDTLLAMTDPETSTPPPQPTSRQPGLVQVKLSNGQVVEGAEMLILLRDRATNRLIVQIGNQAYTGAEPEIDRDFRRRFVTLMKELSTVAPKLSRGAKSSRKPAAPTPAAPPATATPPGTPPSPDGDTLAAQIEQRLQARLQSEPQFSGRSIHVMDAPDGGVRIEVDGQTFDSIGSVSDVDVKALLSDVVAAWQSEKAD